MIMLHCRSPFVQGLQLGIVRLGEYFLYPAEPREKIRTAIVLLAPRDCSCYELETIGHISSILLERWGLLDMLHEGSQVHNCLPGLSQGHQGYLYGHAGYGHCGHGPEGLAGNRQPAGEEIWL